MNESMYNTIKDATMKSFASWDNDRFNWEIMRLTPQLFEKCTQKSNYIATIIFVVKDYYQWLNNSSEFVFIDKPNIVYQPLSYLGSRFPELTKHLHLCKYTFAVAIQENKNSDHFATIRVGCLLQTQSIGEYILKNSCITCGEITKEIKNCANCQYARYCSKKCQKQQWKRVHKMFCGLFPYQ